MSAHRFRPINWDACWFRVFSELTRARITLSSVLPREARHASRLESPFLRRRPPAEGSSVDSFKFRFFTRHENRIVPSHAFGRMSLNCVDDQWRNVWRKRHSRTDRRNGNLNNPSACLCGTIIVAAATRLILPRNADGKNGFLVPMRLAWVSNHRVLVNVSHNLSLVKLPHRRPRDGTCCPGYVVGGDGLLLQFLQPRLCGITSFLEVFPKPV